MQIFPENFSFGKYKNIIFDIGNVILAWRPREVIEKTLQDPAKLEFYLKNVFTHPGWLDFDRGIIESEEQAIEFFTLQLNQPRDDIERLLQVVRESLLPIPESLVLLEECAAKALNLFALTNMPKTTYEYLREKYPFWQNFKDVIVSGRVKMIKPDPAIYTYLLQRNNLIAEETIFLDDNLDNVIAARNLGITALQFTNAKDCIAQLQKLV